MKNFKTAILVTLSTLIMTTKAQSAQVEFIGAVVNPMCETSPLLDKNSKTSGFSVGCAEETPKTTINIDQTPFAYQSGVFDNALIVNKKTNEIIQNGVNIPYEHFESDFLISLKQTTDEPETIYRVVNINYK